MTGPHLTFGGPPSPFLRCQSLSRGRPTLASLPPPPPLFALCPVQSFLSFDRLTFCRVLSRCSCPRHPLFLCALGPPLFSGLRPKQHGDKTNGPVAHAERPEPRSKGHPEPGPCRRGRRLFSAPRTTGGRKAPLFFFGCGVGVKEARQGGFSYGGPTAGCQILAGHHQQAVGSDSTTVSQ